MIAFLALGNCKNTPKYHMIIQIRTGTLRLNSTTKYTSLDTNQLFDSRKTPITKPRIVAIKIPRIETDKVFNKPTK